ncbi:hypothetical protein [Haloferax sp. KTX1]|uniref:hypothetical protein n=1 Tax=Haloferax sp. KTX1 TaxID=2600597 RepID=UPI0016522507|nr:hypothetical protein [Haloferax sp. KTX1]
MRTKTADGGTAPLADDAVESRALVGETSAATREHSAGRAARTNPAGATNILEGLTVL